MTLILSGTNGVSDIDGSAATPAIRGTDSNTGIFFPAADTIAFAEGGAEAMRIDSSGNVGIGTTSPAAKLDVSGSAKATNMSLNGVAIGDYNLYSGMVTRVSNGGGVGINSANSSDNAYIYFGSGTSSAAQQSAAIGRIGGDVLAMFTASSERARIESGGSLLMTTARSTARGRVDIPDTGGTQSVPLAISRGGDAGTMVNFYSTNSTTTTIGTIGNSGNTNTTYNTSSDYRLKENIVPMAGALDTVAALKPVTWNWKSTGADGQGFIAHELAEVVPDCVTGEKDAVDGEGNPVHQGVDTSYLVATLTAAIQEQQALITALTARITALETK
jgi:hypothetical protein